METHSIRSNDADIVVHDHAAPSADGDAPVVFLMHGYTGSSIDFVDVSPALAEAGYRVLRLDHRGHGESTNTGDASTYTFDQMADDALAVLDALDVEVVDLLGHSMGGVIAQRFVLAHPERVRSLVLMDTCGERVDSADREYSEMLAKKGAEEGMAAVYETIRPFLDAANTTKTPEQIELWAGRGREKVLQMDPIAFGSLGEALASFDSMLPGLAALDIPVLVMCGAEDEGFLEPSRIFAATIPGSVLEIVDRAGHCPNEDRPDEWTRLMLAHLARVHGD